MGCCQYFEPVDGGGDSFTVEMPRLTFGRGVLGEVGSRAASWSCTRVALFTDATLAQTEHLERVRRSLREAKVDFGEFAEVRIEPSDRSSLAAADFLRDGDFDGVVSVGGGSVIDTAKVALVYATYPAEFTSYFGKPAGEGVPVPGATPVHIACPTTVGTGSEMTGVAVIEFESLHTKFVIGSRYILPDEAMVDPACADSLSGLVVASSGFDCLSHAIECYTARAHTRWPKVNDPVARPMIQGANPWSDLHAVEALRIAGRYLERAVADNSDREARDQMMWAATLAGAGFGNCGTHMPHAFSYAVSHLARHFDDPAGYPQKRSQAMGSGPKDGPERGPEDGPEDGPESGPVPKAFVPHGVSVIVNSPAVFRWTAEVSPQRHLAAAAHLGAHVGDATPRDAGEVVAGRIIELMRTTGMPNGLSGVGLALEDAEALARSAARQARAIGNAPRDANAADVEGIFRHAVHYW